MKGVPSSVRTVNLAGEALQPGCRNELSEEGGIERVFNLYGHRKAQPDVDDI